MQSVGTLAGGVAHEFNNLLAGINGYAALGLREPGLTPTLREFLQHIVDLSERAAVLTRQLLTFARKPALSPQPTRVAELVRATAELVRRTVHLDVQLDVCDQAADGTPLLVAADANQLQQALVNLALNARDALRESEGPGSSRHTPGTVADSTCNASAPLDGTPSVPASLPAAEETGPHGPLNGAVFRLRPVVLTGELPAFPQNVPPGDYAVLEVVDSGCGMTAEVLSQALDPFFTTKDVGQGTGLGLPMVFGIVQAHQGHLTIDSAPGQGTRVALYLPRLVGPPPGEPPPAFAPGEVLEPEGGPGRTILVVDDEEAVLEVICRFLEIAGHRVTCAASGAEAVELIKGGKTFDLVILDLMMPREDGSHTFHQLRQLQPTLPILLCTGLPDADPAPALMKAGAAGLVRKPFRMNELWYAVERGLAGRNES
jgi:signal transduction histidine kinase/ActR/RegA family two-component response regulator